MDTAYCSSWCNPYETPKQLCMATMALSICATGAGFFATKVKEMVYDRPADPKEMDKARDATLYSGILGIAVALIVPGFVPDPCVAQWATEVVAATVAAGIGYHCKLL